MFFLFAVPVMVQGQFYNGYQMKFGKNRLQFNDFVWQYYRYKDFDVFFYQDGSNLAKFVAKVAKDQIYKLEYFFQYELQKRVLILTYNKLTDFRQSNVGLNSSAGEEYNIGGATQVTDNKMSVYFEGDHNKFEKQIREEISKVFLNEMIFGTSFKTRLANSTLMSFPDWYLNGLASYLAKDWDENIDNRVKDGILSGRYEYFNSLTGDDAKYAGHSIWYFIAKQYGKNTIPNIIYITKLSKTSESGFIFVLGTGIKGLSMEWLDFFDRRYYTEDKKRQQVDFDNVIKKVKKKRRYQHLIVNPTNTNIVAYVTNELGKTKIWIEDITTHKRKKVIRRGQKLQQITDYTNPVIAWHPTGKILAFTEEYQGKVLLHLYDTEEKTVGTKQLVDIEKVLSMNYSPDGFNIAMSVVRNGHSDIVVYNVVGNTFTSITEDLADDLEPHFIDNGDNLIFESNRKKAQNPADDDSLLQETYDLYEANFKTKPISQPATLQKITNTPYSNETDAWQLSTNTYLHCSDTNGIVNFAVSKYDSTISFIDTTIHYRYFTNTYPVSDFSRSIVETYLTGSNLLPTIFYNNGKNVVTILKTDDYNENAKKMPQPTVYKIEKLKQLARQKKGKEKSLQKEEVKKQEFKDSNFPPVDTSNLDINNYVFTVSSERLKTVTLGQNKANDSLTVAKNDEIKKPQLYLTSFYNNYVVNQIDFGFLNTSYQAFTGSAMYFNPGLNALFKIGALDLFENYRITGGVRFAGNFDSNEYLVSLENLKNRIDKQWVFHRQSYLNVADQSLIKTHSHNLMYIMKYPFSQVSAVRATVSGRYDRNVALSTDIQNLNEPIQDTYWEGLKFEYIFDNTFNLGLNLYSGTRAKVFGEFYNQLIEKKTDIYIVGFDFRHYTQIHKNLILANRIAGSKSFGHKLLIYYLGGVDNWINLSNRVPTFDRETPIDYSQPYVFQAIATNMRGFVQNARNGTTFLLSNNEIRWPFVNYFSRRPVNSDFFRNLQLITFFDIGSAWSGPSPTSKENKYNTEVIENGPVTVILDKEKSPYVMGYGFGLRTRILGYFIRADWAWGIDGDVILPKVFYLSLSLDF